MSGSEASGAGGRAAGQAREQVGVLSMDAAGRQTTTPAWKRLLATPASGRLAGTAGLALVVTTWFISMSWAHTWVWHGPLMAIVALSVAYSVYLGFREAFPQQPVTAGIYLWYLVCVLGISMFVSRAGGSLPGAIAVGFALGTFMVMHAPRPQGTPLRRLLIAFLMALVPLGWLAHDYWQALDEWVRASDKNVTARLRRETDKVMEGLGADLEKKVDRLWAEAMRVDDTLEDRVHEMADREWVRFAFCVDEADGTLILSSIYKTEWKVGPDTDRGPNAQISYTSPRRIRLTELEPAARKSFREELARVRDEHPSDKTISSVNRTPDGKLHYYLERKEPGRLWGVQVDDAYLLDQLAADAIDNANLEDKVAIRKDTEVGKGETPLLSHDQVPHLWRFATPVVLPGAYDEAREDANQARWYTNLWFAVLLFWAIGALARLYRTAREDVALAEMKANFVSAISHELKTPLAMIKMYSEMLLLGLVGGGKKPEDYHAIIIAETDRLTRLIDNVLDFSKIQKGTKKYHFEPVDLREVATSALRTMEPVFDSEGVEFELDAPESIEVRADRDAVHQALLNLLSNAAKYGGRAVRLVVARKGRETCITVQDSGPGIATNEQRKIFRPFYRIGSEEQRTAQGTGLGLALVSEIMKAHNGDVRLQSKLGAGSAFTLAFRGGDR